MISVITATYNCVSQLPGLIESLKLQAGEDFEWIVGDGASTDGTLELLQSVKGLQIRISSQPDFGIYDALNRCLGLVRGDYYIVVGADDRFLPGALAGYRRAIGSTQADIIAASVIFEGRQVRVRRGALWLHGAQALISNHSLGTAFRVNLHSRYGLYSRRYPIAADALFVMRACAAGATRVEIELVAGEMGSGGVSATDWLGSATEFFRVQVESGASIAVQTALLILRLLKSANPRVNRLLRRAR
jgi:glycosyltransferase involved in cell wall biosynthesis